MISPLFRRTASVGAVLLISACAATQGDRAPASASSDGDSASSTGGSSSTGGEGGFGLPLPVACSQAKPCAVGEYCNYYNDSCGASQGEGHCALISAECPDAEGPPVCGCDGIVHETTCAAASAGVDLAAAEGACSAPPDTFACGAMFCVFGEQYCKHWIAPSVWWACEPLPEACKPATPAPDCSCFGFQPDKGCGCKAVGETFLITCATE